MKPAKKGFVLVIVAVCGVAMLIIAMAVVFTAGAGQLNAIKDVNIDRSVTIAESGLQRATAYAHAIVKVEKDFDRALDPGLSVNCGATGVAPGAPRYSDAAGTAQWPPGSGVEYVVIPFNGGAYLTRFDDDFDDALPNARLGAFSSNNPANGCNEGPGAPNGNNPFRDRNRSVWISVIGIYPGEDPLTAKHQTALRRFYVGESLTPQPLVRVNDDLTTGHLTFCSTFGDIAVGDDASLSNQTRTCGTLSASDTIANTSLPASCAGHGFTCTHGSDTEGVPFSINVPSVNGGGWYTWSSPCNFFADNSGLYYWDVAGAGCSAHNGGPPSPTAGGLGACWVPLIYVDGGGVPRNLLSWAEVTETGGNAEWRPGPAVASAGAVFPFTFTSGPQNGRVLAAASHAGWGSCTGATAFDWRPPTGPPGLASPACTQCDGATRAWTWVGAAPRPRFDPASPAAVPAAIYFIDQDHAFGGMGLGLPGTDANEADWPQATIIVDGDVTDFSGSGRIGIGTGKVNCGGSPALECAYPSLVVSGDLTMGAGDNWAFGGSVWVDGTATFGNGSNAEVYGLLTVGDDLVIGGGGKLDVVVSTQMIAPEQTPVAVPATGSRTLR